MKKFTLPAGTTNRHRWHKSAVSAIENVTRTFDMVRQKSGVIGTESEHEYVVSVFHFGTQDTKNPDAVAKYDEIGERFGWAVTRENADDIAAAFREILPACMESIPVEDTRRTPEEEAERVAESNRMAAEREKQEQKKAGEVDKIAAKLREQYPHAIGQDSYKTGAARAAANIKAELVRTFPGVKFSVTSDTFSMGDSVDARWTDGPTSSQVDEILAKYQDGHFNGMIDLYEYDRSEYGRAVELVLGRAKYVHSSRSSSEPVKAKATALVCEYYGVGPDDRIEQARDWHDAEPRNHARRFLSDCEIYGEPEAFDDIDGFTMPERPKIRERLDKPDCGYSVEQHTHTKKGFDMYIVVPAERLDRETFNLIRTAAKSAGGWYSRKWGSTPGGFAFKDGETAEQFAAAQLG